MRTRGRVPVPVPVSVPVRKKSRLPLNTTGFPARTQCRAAAGRAPNTFVTIGD